MTQVVNEPEEIAAASPAPDPAPPTDDLARNTVRGASWSAAGQAARQVVQFGISIVTARLLLPHDFGLVAQIVIINALANLITDIGLGAAIVQRKDLEERHTSSVFWVHVGLGTLVMATVMATAPLVASFYGEHELTNVLLVVALSYIPSSMCTVQRALLTRDMRFRATSMIDLVALAGSGGVCVVLAVAGAGVMSIAFQVVALNVITVVLLWAVGGWRPKRRFSRDAVRDLLPYSRNLFAFSIVNRLVRNGDNVIIGRSLGATDLGLYARGYSILLYPTRQITSVLGNVMFSSLSKLSDDPERLKRGYLRAIAIISLVTFPLMAGIAVVAHHFVPALLGNHWLPAVTIIRVFAIVGLGESVFTTVGWLYQATGRTDLLFRVGLALGLLPLAAIVIGVNIGTLDAVVAGYAIASLALLYPVIRIAGSLIDMTFTDVMCSLAPVSLCTAVMVAATLGVDAVLPSGMSHLAALAVDGAAGGAIYVALVHLLHIAPYLDARDQVLVHLRRRSA
ncbi:MAG: hypothetical protein V7636_2558 [Actinomycetota bacterium]